MNLYHFLISWLLERLLCNFECPWEVDQVAWPVYGVYLINVDLASSEPCDKACLTYCHKFIHDCDPTMHHVINHINRMKNLQRGFGPIWRSKLNWPKVIVACFWRSTCQNKIVARASLWRFKQTCATLGAKRSACTKEGDYWKCYFWCGMPWQILATCVVQACT